MKGSFTSKLSETDCQKVGIYEVSFSVEKFIELPEDDRNQYEKRILIQGAL